MNDCMYRNDGNIAVLIRLSLPKKMITEKVYQECNIMRYVKSGDLPHPTVPDSKTTYPWHFSIALRECKEGPLTNNRISNLLVHFHSGALYSSLLYSALLKLIQHVCAEIIYCVLYMFLIIIWPPHLLIAIIPQHTYDLFQGLETL